MDFRIEHKSLPWSDSNFHDSLISNHPPHLRCLQQAPATLQIISHFSASPCHLYCWASAHVVPSVWKTLLPYPTHSLGLNSYAISSRSCLHTFCLPGLPLPTPYHQPGLRHTLPLFSQGTL